MICGDRANPVLVRLVVVVVQIAIVEVHVPSVRGTVLGRLPQLSYS